MNLTELAVHRKNTAAFIAADPVSLALWRSTIERTPSGGRKTVRAEEPQPPQVFRLIPSQDKAPEIKTSTGRLVTPTYTILGTHDADLERWDTFLLNGVWYEVASPIRPEHTVLSRYESKADVVRREDG